jgi:hypothetical protein
LRVSNEWWFIACRCRVYLGLWWSDGEVELCDFVAHDA